MRQNFSMLVILGPGLSAKPQASAAVHNVSTRLGLGFIGPPDPTALVSSC